jgi:hypothetical protein
MEAKNNELAHRHGYDVAMQGAMAIFAVKLKRILTLMK